MLCSLDEKELLNQSNKLTTKQKEQKNRVFKNDGQSLRDSSIPIQVPEMDLPEAH